MKIKTTKQWRRHRHSSYQIRIRRFQSKENRNDLLQQRIPIGLLQKLLSFHLEVMRSRIKKITEIYSFQSHRWPNLIINSKCRSLFAINALVSLINFIILLDFACVHCSLVQGGDGASNCLIYRRTYMRLQNIQCIQYKRECHFNDLGRWKQLISSNIFLCMFSICVTILLSPLPTRIVVFFCVFSEK